MIIALAYVFVVALIECAVVGFFGHLVWNLVIPTMGGPTIDFVQGFFLAVLVYVYSFAMSSVSLGAKS